jgi:hypothetical protein
MSAVEVAGTFVKVARLENEWFVDIDDPDAVIADLQSGRHGRVDLLTFWQRPATATPPFPYYSEPQYVASLPISTYDNWWTTQIDGKTRNLVRKAEKKGLVIRVTAFDQELVDGITRIFNETPVRQGRKFLHYGKSADRVREEMADRPHMSVFIGAYFEEQLVGFVKLLLLKEYAMMVEIISLIAHRDKSPNNALVAAAVRECANRNMPFLLYSTWVEGTLGSFKSNNGFQSVAMPRYYVPLNLAGQAALRMGLHHGAWSLLPEKARDGLKALRARWYARASRSHQAVTDAPQP